MYYALPLVIVIRLMSIPVQQFLCCDDFVAVQQFLKPAFLATKKRNQYKMY